MEVKVIKNIEEEFRLDVLDQKYLCFGIINDGMSQECSEEEKKQLKDIMNEIQLIRDMNTEELKKVYSKEYKEFVAKVIKTF